MDIKEINNYLEKKDISPELKKALEQRKKDLLNNKPILK